MIPGGTYRCSHRTAAGGCCAFQLDGIPIYGNFDHYKYYKFGEPALATTRELEAHEILHLKEMPLTREECYEACFHLGCQGWVRKYELETSVDNESGFAGVWVLREGKKRYHVREVDGTFATGHEAALARAKARTASGQQQARHESRRVGARPALPHDGRRTRRARPTSPSDARLPAATHTLAALALAKEFGAAHS